MFNARIKMGYQSHLNGKGINKTHPMAFIFCLLVTVYLHLHIPAVKSLHTVIKSSRTCP